MSLEDELLELNSLFQMQKEHLERLEELAQEARELLRICKGTLPEGTATGELIEAWEEKVRKVIGEGK